MALGFVTSWYHTLQFWSCFLASQFENCHLGQILVQFEYKSVRSNALAIFIYLRDLATSIKLLSIYGFLSFFLSKSLDRQRFYVKPPSVTTNVVGLQTDDAGHAGQNSSADVARVVGLQTVAVVVTETRLIHSFSHLVFFPKSAIFRHFLQACIFLAHFGYCVHGKA